MLANLNKNYTNSNDYSIGIELENEAMIMDIQNFLKINTIH